MPMPYKAEFFDRDLNYQGWSLMADPEMIFDYLTLDVSKLTLPNSLPIQRGWYVHITESGKAKWQGVVTAVSATEKNTSVSVKPLISLFDTTVMTTVNNNLSAEQYIADILTATFINNSDTVEVINGLEILVNSNTTGVQLATEEETQKIHDVIVSALEKAQIVVNAEFKPSQKKIIVNIGTATATIVKIDADAPGIIDKSFSFRDDYGQVNKVIVYNKDKVSQTAVFYSEDYEPPTVRKITSVSVGDDETFSEKAKEAADKELEKKDFDNCIELSFPSSYKLIPDIEIGQEVNVYHSGKMYTSFLTGRQLSKTGIITLVFGSVRLDLTQILKMEG